MTVVVDPPADAGSVPNGTTATRLGALDGFHAIAATLVFLYHGSVLLGSGSFMLRHWNVVGLFGSLGVSIFFVLSGFLLYRPFVRSMVTDREFPPILDFWTRRLFRIVPAYWVAPRSSRYWTAYISSRWATVRRTSVSCRATGPATPTEASMSPGPS